MPKTVHGIDLTAPGGIEALLAFHYQTFGDAVMQADGEEDEDNDSDEDEDGEDQENSGSEDESDEDEEEVDGADALGDKGQKALRAMKDRVKASKKAEREAKAELERIKNSAGKTEEQLAEQQQREQREAAILNKANERIVRSEIKSAAAGKLQNPALAIRLLDLADFEVDEDGNVDEDDIAQAIDELLEREPYLAVQSGSGPKFDSARGKRKVAKKLTAKDLEGMSPQEIAKAYDEGRVKTS
ncbi:hypothetical protein [Glutamicibacter nicotianae]|uniref:hypothetical protein n=1 Tax=Glutamicibacter nicotianae TaxID=37929 RepID=UPI002552233C|nr:hypothetical protein [Glutamicibacter nicotianae]WIV42579.1 hypothetical protein QQS42_09565 [Glutamicibacter nicotianae]